MRRAIPVVLAAALASPVGLNVPVDAQEARLDRLVQSRSLEQPLPSARRIPLPSDNPLGTGVSVAAGTVAGGEVAEAVENQGRVCAGPYGIRPLSESQALRRIADLAWSK